MRHIDNVGGKEMNDNYEFVVINENYSEKKGSAVKSIESNLFVFSVLIGLDLCEEQTSNT